MKLNGWQRIGVVVSILWAIGGSIYERNSTIQNSYRYYSSSSEVCRGAANRAKETEEILSRDIVAAMEAEKKAYWDCQKQWLDSAEQMRAFNGTAVLNMLAVALIPIAFGWLLAFLGIKTFRWVRAGFTSQSVVQVPARVDIASPAPAASTVGPEKNNTAAAASAHKADADEMRHTPLWLALVAFAVAVLFVAYRLMAKTAGVSPLAFLGDLPNVLPVLARHPDATVNYLAEATGMAVLIPLVHMGIASLFPSMRNKTSRRRIFIGWSVVGAIAATFL